MKVAYISGGRVKWLNHVENYLAASHEFKYTSIPLPPYFITREMKIYVHKKTCKRVFKNCLIHNDPNLKPSIWPSAGEWIIK